MSSWREKAIGRTPTVTWFRQLPEASWDGGWLGCVQYPPGRWWILVDNGEEGIRKFKMDKDRMEYLDAWIKKIGQIFLRQS